MVELRIGCLIVFHGQRAIPSNGRMKQWMDEFCRLLEGLTEVRSRCELLVGKHLDSQMGCGGIPPAQAASQEEERSIRVSCRIAFQRRLAFSQCGWWWGCGELSAIDLRKLESSRDQSSGLTQCRLALEGA